MREKTESYLGRAIVVAGVLIFAGWAAYQNKACGQVPSGPPQSAVATGQRILQPVSAAMIYAQPTVMTPGSPKDIISVSGSGRFDVDGAPLMLGGDAGRLFFIGAGWSAPKYIARVSRAAGGDTINHSALTNCDFIGYCQRRYAMVINDGSECSRYVGCQFTYGLGGPDGDRYNQHFPDGCAFELNSADRTELDAATNRARATNSRHTIENCTFAVWTPCPVTGPNRGACIRIAGTTTDVNIVRSWVSGNAPIVIIDSPDELNTWNQPRRIVIEDTAPESAASAQIRLYGYQRIGGAIALRVEAGPHRVAYKLRKEIDPTEPEIVTLRGTSVGWFRVYDGDSATPIPLP